MSRNGPKIRFEKFTEPWEQRKFKDFFDSKDGIRRGPFGSALKKDIFVNQSEFVVYEQRNAIYDIFDTRYYITKEKYHELIKFKIEPGDFIMSGAGTIGRISKIPNGVKSGVFNQALIRFKLDCKKVDSEYFLQLMRAEKMQSKLTSSNPGSAMVNLVPMSELKEWSILIPTILEQEMIGEFLSEIDEIIILQERKLNKYKKIKKAYLSSMFPKNGHKFPFLRFSGFTDPWEQRKLGELGTTYNGLSGKTKEDFGIGDAEFITYLNVFHNPLSNILLTENVEIDDKQNEVRYGDILFTTSSETPHEVGMSSVWLDDRANVYLNSFCFGFRMFNKQDPAYMAYLLRSLTVRRQFELLAQGISRYNISKIKAMDILVDIPNRDEQKLIGQIFTSFDKTITLHQRKLDKLKDLKKAYLNEMFV